MKKIILLILISLLFSPLKSQVWEKADGPFEYDYLNKIFTFNNELFVSEKSGLEKTYKQNKNGWDQLDTGFFSDKGTVFYFEQKENVIFASIGRKMYLSYDAGKNWKKFDTLDGNIRYYFVAIVDSTIFLQANQFFSLHKLEKGSDTLEKIFSDDKEKDSIFADIIVSKDNYIFAADPSKHYDAEDTVGTLYISSDKGKTWHLSESMKKQIKNLLFHNNILFAFTVNDGLYISKDLGQTWTTDTNIVLNVSKVLSYKNKIFACSNQINISTDNGKTWEISTNNGLDNYQSCKDILVNNDTLYYLSSRSIIFYSTDGGNQWIRKSPMTDDVKTNSIVEVRDTLFSTGSYSIYYSTNNGKLWKMYSDSLYNNYTYLNEINIKDSVFAIVNDNYTSFFISTDYGKSWKYENLGIYTSQSWINSVIIFGNRIFVSGSYGNFISEDMGLTWNEYDNNVLKKDTRITTYIRLSENEIILYSTQGLYISMDNGLTWEYETTDGKSRINDYSTKEKNYIYTMDAGNHKIFKTTDLGRTWADLELNIEPNLYWIRLISYNGYLILLTNPDVYISSNEGKDWTKYEVDLLMPNGKKLYFYSGVVSNDYLVLTSSNGIWRAKLSDLDIVK